MKKILIIAGESSGDLHAAALIKSCLAKDTNLNFSGLNFFGIGGDKMRAAGAEIIIDNKALAVVGIIEVLTHFKIIKAAFRQIQSILKNNPPDLLILVDYPGFNLRLAKFAKKQGVKTLYFISPQLWAWKKGRIKIIQNCVDKVAVIFPFEVDFYREHQVNASYVGNPMLEEVYPTITKEQAYKLFNLSPENPIVAILPGSRQSELKYMFETLLQTAIQIKQAIPNVQFIIPMANHFSEQQLRPSILRHSLDIRVVPKQLYNILQISNVALCVSGTVTLEVALMKTPFVILYKVNWLTYWLVRSLVTIDKIGLCNIVAGKKIAAEYIQHAANPDNLSKEILRLLNDKTYRENQLTDFTCLRDQFKQYPSEDIADVVIGLIGQSHE